MKVRLHQPGEEVRHELTDGVTIVLRAPDREAGRSISRALLAGMKGSDDAYISERESAVEKLFDRIDGIDTESPPVNSGHPDLVSYLYSSGLFEYVWKAIVEEFEAVDLETLKNSPSPQPA